MTPWLQPLQSSHVAPPVESCCPSSHSFKCAVDMTPWLQTLQSSHVAPPVTHSNVPLTWPLGCRHFSRVMLPLQSLMSVSLPNADVTPAGHSPFPGTPVYIAGIEDTVLSLVCRPDYGFTCLCIIQISSCFFLCLSQMFSFCGGSSCTYLQCLNPLNRSRLKCSRLWHVPRRSRCWEVTDSSIRYCVNLRYSTSIIAAEPQTIQS